MKPAKGLCLVLLLSAFAVADDVKDAKEKMIKAILAKNEADFAAAAQTLGGLDRRPAVETLLSVYAHLAKMIYEDATPKLEEARKDLRKAQESRDALVIKNKKKAEAKDVIDNCEADIARYRNGQSVLMAQIGHFKSPEAVNELIDGMKKGGEWGVRAGIAEALGTVDHPEAVKALESVVDEKREPAAGVRLAAIDALGKKRSASSIKPLGDALKDSWWQVQFAALDALRAIGSRDAIPQIIEALKDAEGTGKVKLNETLVALSGGVDKHGDYNVWKLWWDSEGKTGATGNPAAGGADAQGQLVLKAGRAGMTAFYGIPIVSKRIVFVLDRSGSMKEETTWKPEDVTESGPGAPAKKDKIGKRKIDVAKFELEKAVNGLPEDAEFNVIFYSVQMTILQEKVLLPATKGNKERAIQFIRDIEPLGNTNICDSTLMAMKLQGSQAKKKPGAAGGGGHPGAGGYVTAAESGPTYNGPDTIFLLTDGLPTAGSLTDPKKILEKFGDENKVCRVTINTIGVGMKDNKAGEDFLQKISKDTGGVFVAR